MAVAGSAGVVAAQPLRPERPVTRLVGTPGGARVDRVDPQRTGLSSSPLPASNLRVAWRTAVKATLDRAPVVDAHGVVYVVGARGEVFATGDDGVARWELATGAPGAGPAALLSDDTVAFVDGSGQAVAVRGGRLRWRARVGAPDSTYAPAPLALDEGGIVAASAADLAAIDAAGQEIARVHLPELVAAPLVGSKDRVLAVTSSGAVWSWVPGAVDAARIGTFESPIEGSAALAGEDALLAITHAGARLTELRLHDGTTRIRAASGGNIWPGSPAVAGGLAFVVALTPSGAVATAFDASGKDLGSAPLQAQTFAADAGAPLLQPARPAPIVVDGASTVVFATTTGAVGAVRRLGQPDESVETLASVCSALSTGSATPVSGIAPLPPRGIVVACHHGELVAVTGPRDPKGG
jgi:hypothetical protein